MSWIDKVQTQYVIVTGDDKVYTPLWLKASKYKEFNTAVFDFNKTKGSLVYRGQPKGRVYNIEVYFQGEDHLEVAEAFDKSSDNPKAWTITHPLYGEMIVQPIELIFDNDDLNTTRISGRIIETISDRKLTPVVSAPDKITEDAATVMQGFSDTYVNNVPVAKVSDIQKLQKSVTKLYSGISSKIADAADYSDFTNTYSQVNTLINTTVYDTTAIIGQVQAVIAFPASFADTVINRVKMLYDQLAGLFTITASSGYALKKQYETMGGTLVSAICVASITNYNYQTRNDVVQVIDIITTAWNDYVRNLDDVQSTNGGREGSYIPDPTPVYGLGRLINYTITSLFTIAAGSKQQRTMYVADDITLAGLAYKVYGDLQPDDSTITLLRETNEIGMDELLIIQKGRKIIYYV